MGKQMLGEGGEAVGSLVPRIVSNVLRRQFVDQGVEFGKQPRVLRHHLAGGYREPRHPRDRFLEEATLLLLHEVFAEVVAQLLKSVADGLRRWRVRIVPDGEIGPQGEQPGVQVAVLAEKVSENDGIDAS